MTIDTDTPSVEGHTPTPWLADPDDREGYEWNIHILQASDTNIRVCFMSNGPASEANAHLIVTAVNQHASLLKCREALVEARRILKSDGYTDKGLAFIDAALSASAQEDAP